MRNEKLTEVSVSYFFLASNCSQLFSQAPMSIIYKHNFVDLALIVAFSVSTVIITDY